jgi:hypothetical protein
MKPLNAALLGLAIGLAPQATPAAAWMQRNHHYFPIASPPAFWLYQQTAHGPNLSVPQLRFCQTPASAQVQPVSWQYQWFPQGLASMWTTTLPMTGLYVEQSQSPFGYSVRVSTGHHAAEDVSITVEGGALVIRRSLADGTHAGGPKQTIRSSWFTQLVALPADANFAAMQMQRGNGIVDIYIPRVRRR